MKLIVNLLFGFLTVFCAASAASAATIEKSKIDLCVVSIAGEIQPGDFEKFLPIARSNFPGDNGESTAADIVCLDSLGGSFPEAVKFAHYFYKEGVGTVIAEGQKCYSACAIMFMMGKAEGAEVSFINRKLHVHGQLGFDRPVLNTEFDEPVTATTLPLVHDRALKTALDLVAIANSLSPWSNAPMMKSDLIQVILEHAGHDALMIDTVDKAARWDIELIGVATQKYLSEEQAYYACQNSLQWRTGLTKEDITYKPKIVPEYESDLMVEPIGSGKGTAFNVVGLNNGYVGAGCVISFDGDFLKGCGFDENYDVILGKGACDRSNYTELSTPLNQLSVFNPRTKIANLDQPFTPGAGELARSVRCVVLHQFKVQDDQRCRVTEGVPTATQNKVTYFQWPSGAKTVLITLTNGQLQINGISTSQQSGVEDFGTCFSILKP
jgi:hypothetical protein